MPNDKTLRLDREFVQDLSQDLRTLRKEIMAELIDEGIVPASQPIDIRTGRTTRPELAEVRLSQLDPDSTLDLLGQYSAWLEFVDSRAAEYRVRLSEARRKTRDIKAQIRSVTKGTAADKADTATLDPRFREADKKEFEAEVRAEMAEAALNGGERSFFTVSRAITAQGHELGRTVREHNVAPSRKGDYGAPRTQRKRR